MRPLIGIPCHADSRAGTGRPIYGNNRSYIHALEQAGAVPLLIPMLKDLRGLDTLLPRLDGLLLSGGVDVQPALYGEEPHPLTDQFDKQLDEFEMELASLVLQEDMPVLGICRGMQILNIMQGGSLYQDLVEQYPGSMQHCRRELPRNEIIHDVMIEPGSRIEKILGTRRVAVNSLHHQALREAGKGVQISGRAEDGVAEFMEVSGYQFVIGVQCHPEEIYTKAPVFARLFSAFVRACGHEAEVEDEVEMETLTVTTEMLGQPVHS